MRGLIVDNFAGGGGASLGIERAMGRPVDIAINHDPAALAMHRANHPHTRHICENVFAVDPVRLCAGRSVDMAWFSPDCTHHSKAKGGRPLKKNIRGLAWIVVRWARTVRPRLIVLENVEEFQDWGPLDVENRPYKRRKGQTFNFWAEKLRRHGYRVEWWLLRGCDFGAPTIRKRLFLVARCDGLPIVRPDPSHGDGLEPYRTAADCIDWSIPVHSIFLTPDEARAAGVRRPLAEATMRRIARGVFRYVIDAADPFIISVAHGDSGGRREYDIGDPLGTVTESRTHALVAPHLTRFNQNGIGLAMDEPFDTVMAGAPRFGLVAAFLAQHNTGVVGHDAREPVSTIIGRGCTQALVASHLVSLKGGGGRGGRPVTEPAPTITAGGWHVAEVRAFLMKYYGTGGQWQDCREPLHTLTAKARIGLVTVAGVDYRIADIGMRMLTPRELFRAQGFPDSYRIDPPFNGKPMTKTAQIGRCGNSVCPDVAEAVVRANAAAADAPLFGFAGAAQP